MVHSQSNPFLFPFASLFDLNRNLGNGVIQTLQEGTKGYATRGHLFHDEDGATWVAHVPGVQADDLELLVDGRNVQLSSSVPTDEGSDEESDPTQVERFEQKLRMAFDIDGDRAEATIWHGVLLVRLPKRQVAQGKRIPIQS